MAGTAVAVPALLPVSVVLSSAAYTFVLQSVTWQKSRRRVSMGGEISWHVQLRVKPGQLGNLRTLTAEMVGATRREPGVLSYQRFVSEDGTIIHVYERYADSAVAV